LKAFLIAFNDILKTGIRVLLFFFSSIIFILIDFLFVIGLFVFLRLLLLSSQFHLSSKLFILLSHSSSFVFKLFARYKKSDFVDKSSFGDLSIFEELKAFTLIGNKERYFNLVFSLVTKLNTSFLQPLSGFFQDHLSALSRRIIHKSLLLGAVCILHWSEISLTLNLEHAEFALGHFRHHVVDEKLEFPAR